MYKGVYIGISVSSGGRSPIRSGGRSPILRRELLPQFLTNSHEIWQRCLPWSVDVQDTFFDSDRKSVAMVTAYYGKKWGKNLASRTTSSVFSPILMKFGRDVCLGV